jgi:hypothetical protein
MPWGPMSSPDGGRSVNNCAKDRTHISRNQWEIRNITDASIIVSFVRCFQTQLVRDRKRLELGWLSQYSDWLRAGRPGFVSCQEKKTEFSILHSVQTGYGVHTASNSLCTAPSFPEGKAAGALNLVPRSRKLELYLHSPIHFHCLMLN